MRLKYLRRSKGFTLKDVERKTGIHYSYLSKIENGYANISDEQYNQLRDLFNEDFELEPIASFVRENELLKRENELLSETIRHLAEDKEHLKKYINNLKKYMNRVRGAIDVFNNIQ